ncbi:MAG: TraC family protein [Proteobacteria bacterium]|nr:TraC family protein [Pseudomonadota bacterium]
MKPSQHPRASQLFSILAYDAEDGLFLTEDRSLAFGFICQPLSGADPAVADRVNVLLNQDWPVDTLLQVSLWTSPDIDATLALMQVRRIAQQQPFHKDMLHATVEFLGQGAQSSLDGATGIRLRRMQVLVTVKLPMTGAMPNESDIHRAAELRLSTFQSLGTIGLRPETLGSDHYVRLLSTMLRVS